MIEITMQQFVKNKFKKELTFILILMLILTTASFVVSFNIVGDKTIEVKTNTCLSSGESGGIASVCTKSVKGTKEISLRIITFGFVSIGAVVVTGIMLLSLYSNISYKEIEKIKENDLSLRYADAYNRYILKKSIKL